MIPAGLRRPRVIVLAPLATLLHGPLAPGAALDTGTGAMVPISGEAARRIACNAQIIRLVTGPTSPGGNGPSASAWTATAQLKHRLAQAIATLPPPLATPPALLDIGRASQGWTNRQRDALSAQYGGRCAFPLGCSAAIEVIHHLKHWADGGRTSIDNGWPGCEYHHWLIHEGGWRLAKARDGTLTAIPPPPGWQPGTIYRHGKPLTDRPAA